MTVSVDDPGNAPYPRGVAVVIGGSGAIGGAVCLKLAQHGADVALTYRNGAVAANRVSKEVESSGRQATVSQLTLSDADAVGAFFDAAVAHFGRLHTVIFAAGADISMSYVSEVNRQEWLQTLDHDLNGFFYVVQAALPYLRRGGGSIVAMTSAGTIRHAQKDILSIAPKAAIEALVKGIAREEGRFGVRANCVALGVIDAGLFHRLETRVTAEFAKAMQSNVALKRFGTVNEAADAAIFLSSASSSFTTGAILPVDGGYSV